MSPHILITGGTGTLGSHVVPLLQHTGQQLSVLSRHPHPSQHNLRYIKADLTTGEGLDEAVQGVETVLHLAGGPRGDDISTENLLRAIEKTGNVQHLVMISVIGAGKIPIGYFERKARAEKIIASSDTPYTILRAAQFHELTLHTVHAMTKLPFLLVAPRGVRWQPVASRDVATRLVELTRGKPAGHVPDLPGPHTYTLEELQQSYLATQGKHRRSLPLRVPGKIGKAYRSGLNLAQGVPTGSGTWEEFLHDHVNNR